MQQVTYKRATLGGRPVEVTDRAGGVFAPAETATRIVYVYGPTSQPGQAAGVGRDAMYTCPVSGISPEIWELLMVWNECNQMGALPRAGGVLDQPLAVRRSFPVFAFEWSRLMRDHDKNTMAAGVALAFGGGKK